MAPFRCALKVAAGGGPYLFFSGFRFAIGEPQRMDNVDYINRHQGKGKDTGRAQTLGCLFAMSGFGGRIGY